MSFFPYPNCRVTINQLYRDNPEALVLAQEAEKWFGNYFKEIKDGEEVFEFQKVKEAYQNFLTPLVEQLYKNQNDAEVAIKSHIVRLKKAYETSDLELRWWNFQRAAIKDLENLVENASEVKA